MDFKKLRTFRVAAQCHNFSDAAVQLGYVQSAITTQIKALEEELGADLFSRNGRGVTLTEAGSTLLQYSDKLFALRDEATQAVRDTRVTPAPVRIAGYETILSYRLPPIIQQFNHEFPDANLLIQPAAVKQIRQLLLTDQIDFGLIYGCAENSTQQLLAGLSQTAMGKEEVIIVAAPCHPLTKEKNIALTRLAGETLLLTEQGCYYRNQFERALIQSGAMSGTLLEFTSIEAIKACIKMATGIAAISKISVQSMLDSGEIAQLDIPELQLSVDLLLVTKQKPHNATVQSFIDGLSGLSAT